MPNFLKTSSIDSNRHDALEAAGLRSTVAARAILDLFEWEGEVMLTHAQRVYQLVKLPQALQDVCRQVLVRWEAQEPQGLAADVAVRGVCVRCLPH